MHEEKISRPVTADDESDGQFLRRHKVLVRKTRDAAHQALFFLGLLQPTTSEEARRAVGEYRQFGLQQVRSLVRGIHLRSDAYDRVRRRLEGDEPAPEVRPALTKAVAEYDAWREIFDRLRPADGADVDPRALRIRLSRYLDSTSGRLSAPHGLRSVGLLGFLHKNLALLWAAVLVLVVFFAVEPVHVLLRYGGTSSLIGVGLLAVPLLVSRIWSHRSAERNGGAVPFWDLAGPAFRSLRAQAREPGSLIERWPGGAGLPRRSALGLTGSLLLWLLVVGGVGHLVSKGWEMGYYTQGLVLLAGFVVFVVVGARWLRGSSLRWQIAAGHAVKLTGYLAWWLVVVAGYGLLAWTGQVSDSVVTVFLVLSLAYFVLLVAHLLDFWDFLDPLPVRFLGLVGAAVTLAFLVVGYGRAFFLLVFALGSLGLLLRFLRERRRLPALVGSGALLVLALLLYLGGETHERDEWVNGNGEALARLERGEWPFRTDSDEPVVVLAASGGGSRAAYYTALTLQHLHRDEPDLARRLEAISSVSGGSLANAAYVARRLRRDPSLGRLEAGEGEDASQLLQNAVGGDFLLPTLKGALVPGTSRGREIQNAWDEGPVGLRGLRLGALVYEWRQARDRKDPDPPFPVPLFNSTTLDAHAVVISPLAYPLYTRPELRREALADDRWAKATDATWVRYRDGIYGLEDFLPSYDPQLSAAVRASANFPFGFPLVRLRDPDQAPFFSPGWRRADADAVSLTDGGALSNSGMWTLTNLLLNNVGELRHRGVLVIIVDASKMPTYRGVRRKLQSLWGTIGDQAPIAQNLHRRMLDLLEREYGNRLAVVQIDLLPDTTHNVLTTWALDPGSEETLQASFAERWRQERRNLHAAWRALTGDEPASSPLVARARPPLD